MPFPALKARLTARASLGFCRLLNASVSFCIIRSALVNDLYRLALPERQNDTKWHTSLANAYFLCAAVFADALEFNVVPN